MTTSQDPLRTLIQDWAEQDTLKQTTPLTPSLLRCKSRLAQEDARGARLRRLRYILLIPPTILALWLVSDLGNSSALLQNLLALNSSTLGSILTLFAIGALIGPAMASD